MLNVAEYVIIAVCTWALYKVCIVLWNLMVGIVVYVLPNLKLRCPVNLVEKFGSWAVITGSSDGIGKEYAKELAKRGMNVVLISRSPKKLKKVALEIEDKYKVKTKIIVADFSLGEAVYEHIKVELDNIPVGILVNNVGIYAEVPKYFYENSFQEIWTMLHVNVSSALGMTRLILPQMIERRKGAVVVMSSLGELVGLPLASVYSASKIFLKSFADALRFECRPHGITVQVLSPSFVKTNMTEYIKGSVLYYLFSVDVKKFTRSAVNTLGVINYTSGYWTHELHHFFVGCVPSWITINALGSTTERLRLSHLRKLGQ